MTSRRFVAVTVLAWLTELGVCAGQGVLQPAGDASRRIAHLTTPILVVFAVISVFMWALVFWAVMRRTGSFDRHVPIADEQQTGRGWIVLGGIVFPVVTLSILLVASLRSLATFETGYTDHPHSTDLLIVGHQWWWEVRYQTPEGDIASANELHIPAGRLVNIDLASRDVIHSFWVPSLHGKVDLVPGVLNHVQLQAERPGTFQGQCAEYCGPQHAMMRLVVDADPPAAYDAWLEHEATDAAAPMTDQETRGAQLFMARQCALCHTIRGTLAHGEIGPDLTHFASRKGLASSAYRNDLANLSAWVTHAQALKPYAQMPDVTAFTGDELQALVAYLRRLQ